VKVDYIGEWHPVTAEDITPEGDWDLDLDITVEHLPECPTYEGRADCALGMEIAASGYDGFDVTLTEAGTYRARYIEGKYPDTPSTGTGERDSFIEVERVAA
jgi:hypothetical protein